MRTVQTLLSAAALLLCVDATDATVIIGNFSASSGTGTAFGSNSSTQTKDFGWTMGAIAYRFDSVTLTMDMTGNGIPQITLWEGATAPTIQLDILINPPFSGTADYVFSPTRPITMQANRTYWIRVIETSGTASFLWSGTSPATIPSGLASPVGYLWNGSSSSYYNRLQVDGSIPCAGTILFGGTGCADSGGTPNTLSYSGCPDLGATLTIEMNTSAGATGPLFLIFGISDQNWGGIALPLDLGPFGAPGCFNYISQEFVLGGVMPSSGQATLGLSIPRAPYLAGATSYLQFFHLDPGLNPLNLAASDYLTVTIG